MQIKNTKEAKNHLREKFRAIRSGLTDDIRRQKDAAVLDKLTSLRQYRAAECVLTYVSKDSECDTLRFIEKALTDGKQVAVPRCVSGTRRMDFYYITSLQQLEVSTFGVMEPIVDQCRLFAGSGRNTLCIVPGMAFDASGFRLGYGKGYYDRFLAEYEGTTVGICYSECVRWSLPRGRFDKAVDLLVTDRFLRKIRKSGP